MFSTDLPRPQVKGETTLHFLTRAHDGNAAGFGGVLRGEGISISCILFFWSRSYLYTVRLHEQSLRVNGKSRGVLFNSFSGHVDLSTL